jgi:hypothetical protein
MTVQLGALISLYISITFFLSLIFGLINLWFPLDLTYSYEITSSQDQIRLGIAMVAIFFPAFFLATRIAQQMRRRQQVLESSLIVRIIMYLSLLIGVLTILGTTATTFYTFLSGELTIRFITKVLALVLVTGSALLYFTLDLRHYWLTHERRSWIFGGLVAITVLGTIVVAITQIETPKQTQARELDERQVMALSTIEYWVFEHYASYGRYPETLRSIEMQYSVEIETTIEDRAPIEYRTSDQGFALCAEFATASQDRQPRPVAETPQFTNAGNWNHPAGWHCFERTLISNTP